MQGQPSSSVPPHLAARLATLHRRQQQQQEEGDSEERPQWQQGQAHAAPAAAQPPGSSRPAGEQLRPAGGGDAVQRGLDFSARAALLRARLEAASKAPASPPPPPAAATEPAAAAAAPAAMSAERAKATWEKQPMADAGGMSQQQAAGLQRPDSGLLARVAVLRSRLQGAAAPGSCQPFGEAAEQPAAPTECFSRPEDFVESLQQLLAAERYDAADEGWEDEDPAAAAPDAMDTDQCVGEAIPALPASPGSRAAGGANRQQQQQHEQQSHGTAIPAHAQRLLALASQSLLRGEHAAARERAAAAMAAASSGNPARPGAPTAAAAAAAETADSTSFCRHAAQLHSAATILLHVAEQQWLAALGLPAQPCPSSAAGAGPNAAACASLAEVRRAYRQLAAVVHPDKFAHSTAASAFRALTEAHEQALASLGGSAGSPTADGCADAAGADADGAGSADYAWWTAWERDVAGGSVDGAAAAGGGSSWRTSEPSPADEEQLLWQLSMQELAAEVARRQAGVLQPASLEEAALPPMERQKRLRVARSVLSARAQEQRQQQSAAAATGGSAFVGSSCFGATSAAAGGFFEAAAGSIADGDDDVAGWKRQRMNAHLG